MKGDVPRVSVIIPCWNAAPFVREAIESALLQSYESLEVVVIDDGSTDGSQEIIQSFGERIRYIAGPHAGACAARNLGQRAARGEYWLFLDADDVLAPDAAAILMNAVETSGANAAYGNTIVTDERLKPKATREYKSIIGIVNVKWLLLFGVPVTSGVLCSRHTSITWDESLSSCQEFHYFMMRAMSGDQFIHVPGTTAFIREHSATIRISNQAPAAFVVSCAQSLFDIEQKLVAAQSLDNETRALMSNAYLGVYVAARRIGLNDLTERLGSKIDRSEIRRHPHFRWVSTAGVCVLAGVRLAAMANALLASVTKFRRMQARV